MKENGAARKSIVSCTLRGAGYILFCCLLTVLPVSAGGLRNTHKAGMQHDKG